VTRLPHGGSAGARSRPARCSSAARAACLAWALAIAPSAGCSEAVPPRPEPAPLWDPTLFGVIEGYYGPPFAPAARLALVEALGAMGANAYVYGPKDDPLHREAWRDPYPEAMLSHFGELASVGQSVGVRFVFAISPGEGFDRAGDDLATLLGKIDALRGRGVRDFALFFDDVAPDSPGADPDVQVEILLGVRAHLREVEPDGLLAFAPTYYIGTADQLASDEPPPFPAEYADPPSRFYRAYDRVPTDVAIFWTGRAVFTAELDEAEAAAFRDFTRRPTLLWDNLPVNDQLLAAEPYLGPWVGRDPAIFDVLDGVLLNLMPLPSASMLTVETALRARDEGSAYDPWAAWATAIDARGGEGLGALAEHFEGHPFIGDGTEGGAFAPLAAAFLADPSPATEAPLRAELARLDDHRELFLALPDATLVADLDAESAKLELLAQAGLQGLDQWVVLEGGGVPDLGGLSSLRTAAASTPWAVGANLQVPAALGAYLSEGPNHPADHWGAFLDGLEALLSP